MAMSRAAGGTSFTTSSPIMTFPSSTSSRPAIMRNVVVLPQPDGPSRTRNSLSSASSDTLLTAMTLPKRFVTFFRTTFAMSSSAGGRHGESRSEKRDKALRQGHRCQQRIAGSRGQGVPRPAGTVWLWQDDDVAHDRRPGAGRRGEGHYRR